MFNWWRKWRLERRAAAATELQEFMAAQAVGAQDNAEGKNSEEPWVTIVGDAVGEEGIQLSLDWNDAFIKFLKAAGIDGTDDTAIVQKWLAMVAKEQADRLGEARLELEGKVNEFE